MSRYQTPFVPRTDAFRGQDNSIINMAQAGTRQLAPDLANIASNTPHVARNVLAFLIEAPRFFQYASNPDLAVRCLKAFIENHTRTIDGLNQTINLETGDALVGGSGERIQVPTNVTREVSNPTHGAWELKGRAIQRFLKWWITYGIGDENTKVPLIVADGLMPAEEYDATFYGATVLYIEPDPSMTEVVSAYLCTNMFPTTTTPWENRKDASQLGQQIDLSIPFTALTDVSLGTQLYAREFLRSLNLAGLNPNETELALEGISADVAKAQNGLAAQLEEGASNRISY